MTTLIKKQQMSVLDYIKKYAIIYVMFEQKFKILDYVPG